MNCEKVQFLMALYIADDPDLTDKQRIAFEEHLQKCQKCTEEYQESKFIIDLAKEHWQISDDALALIEKAGKSDEPRMTVDEGWQDLLRRCPDLAQRVKRRKCLQLFRRISAVAACLVIGILTWITFSVHSTPQIVTKPASQQVVFATKASVKIEVLSKNGSILIPANQQIASTDELKTLVINGKHRMVMNANTILAIKPLVEINRIGCLVKLDSGRIYTHVEHDGNPFVVDTVHGDAVITGTTFGIKATDNSTTLMVAEGTVQFGSEEGIVEVTAGQISEIVKQSTPTKPIACNISELTAWATGYKPSNALAQTKSATDAYDITNLLLFGTERPIDLESVNYDDWVEENRDWFKQEFPWVFQLKVALARDGVEVDYPELLMQSGDIWRFVWTEVSRTQVLPLDSDLLIKVASYYGFDEQSLFEVVPSAKFVTGVINTKDRLFGLDAFSKWVTCLEDTRNSSKELDWGTLLYSLHASTYLINTKTLVWLNVKNDTFTCDVKDRSKLLLLLHEEVQAACNCVETLKLAATPQHKSCSPEYLEVLKHILKNTNVIYESEKAIHELRLNQL